MGIVFTLTEEESVVQKITRNNTKKMLDLETKPFGIITEFCYLREQAQFWMIGISYVWGIGFLV
jgi:hypothetical protein